MQTGVEINNDDGELTDKVIKDAFKKVSSFFKSEVKNPVGKRIMKDLKKTGQKELIPSQFSKSEIKSALSVWFQKK